ncbi:hypothetical protein Q7A53_18320 [Halobacillus rhizosphaerae]|uniref:hypothetical protein n=1 Tax=Halobacillus rhizosphaerae TaxID=3064889 RepID=UPI00398ACD07
MIHLFDVTRFIPFLLIAAFVNTFSAYVSFRRRKYLYTMLSGVLQIILSIFFAFSIGPVLFGLGSLQIYLGLIHMKKAKPIRLN